MSNATCSEAECMKSVLARGWCGTHYARWRRAQQPPKDGRSSAVDRGDGSKTCTRCREVKAAGEFYPRRDRDGAIRWLSPECKGCSRARVARDAKARDQAGAATSGPVCLAPGCENRVGERASNTGASPRFCSRRCKDSVRERQPMPYEDMVRYHRAKTLRKYGLTADDWFALLEVQENRCGICRADSAGGKGLWHIDHCHETGRVRGLLCHQCNVGLGNFKDDPGLLRTAIAYLEAVV